MKTHAVLSICYLLLALLLITAPMAKAVELSGDTLTRAPAHVSFSQAPPEASQKSLPAQRHSMATSDVGYGHNVQTGEIYQFDPAFPELPGFVAMLEMPTASGDFAPDNPSTMHMIDMTDNMLASMDISTGEITNTVPLNMPMEGGFWTVLAINKVSGDYYGVVTNGEQSNLYNIDPLSGVSSLVMIMEIPAVISGSFDGGGMLYLFDIAYDNIWQLDVNIPGDEPVLLGPAGFDGDFFQGMGYCPWMNEIYLASCDVLGAAELRLLDRSNGLTMPLSPLPGETTAFGFPYEVQSPDPLVRAGRDEYTIPTGTLDFGEDLPPVPPDFFGPGSLPFEGTVHFEGTHSEGSQLPQTDLSLLRNEDVHVPQPYPASGLSPTEINELEMRSREPVPVNIGGVDSFFDIWVELAPMPQPGEITIFKMNPNGGTFNMHMLLMPVIIFRNIDNPSQEFVFYPMEYGYEGLLLVSDEFPWMAPPIEGEFDPFGEGGLTLITPAGNTITAVPLLRREDFAFLSMDEEGQPEAWEGTGFSNSEWFYYPNYDWWNVWFYDHPLDVTRMKIVGGFIDIMPRDVSIPSYVEIILGWSTPEWPTWGGFPEDAAPPLPPDVIDPQVELQMIERTQPFFSFEGTLDETSTIEIPSEFTDKLTGLYNFNPEWIFIDVRGYNFMLSGTFWHTCFKPWSGCEVVCPPDMTVCSTDEAFTLSGASPAGGTYSGSGVGDDGSFNPGIANWGDNTITYSYICPDGTIATCTFIIHVIPPPEMVCPPNMSVCYSDWLITLPDGFPSGGTFSGPGISGNQFKTFVAGIGTHTITYSVTDPCPGSCTFTIMVHPNPVVTCPDDFTMCANDPILNLQTLVSPSGGSFGGGNTFNPATAPHGVPLQFNYTYTDPQTNCTSSCTFYIMVHPNPVVTCPGDTTMCADDPVVNLQSLVSPSGGTFMGGDTFDPGAAPPGVPLQFNYTYTDPVTGCKGYCTFYITTYPNPVVTCPPNDSACIDDPPFALAGATPAGGSYSGAGVAGGNFNPAGAGVGNHTITYIYTDANGCSGSCTFTITVNDKPQVSCPPNMARCENDPAFTLTGASSPGGNYSGAGVAGGIFSPANAGAGNHIITYTYTDPQTGCSTSCTFTITVHALPNVACPGNISKCIDDPAFALGGATPAGGNYSGPGVVAGNFSPLNAGVGVHTITYTYTDPQTGCTNTCSFKITVHPLPTVTCPPDTTVCDNDPAFALGGATPAGGKYSNFWGIPFVNFNPAAWGAGVHAIFYDYTDPVTNCSNWCVFTITVLASPNVICPPNMNVCINGGLVPLAGAAPAGGWYWSNGPGIVGGNFNPAVAGVGAHVIFYSYTDPATGCTGTCSYTITVNPLPIVICPPNITVCDNDPAFPLAGATPAGGTYTIGAVPIVNFNPAIAPLGPNVITYSYTDPLTGCTGTCTFTITVIASPVVTCPPNKTVCDNDPAFPLAGATPAGGTYTIGAVPIVNFNPAIAPLGPNVITYSYTDPLTGCTGTCAFTITVIASPVVICPPNMSVCINGGLVPLAGGAPAGGWYWSNGPGIVGGNFNPAVAGVGAHVIFYSYTDPATGCTGTCSYTITVNPLPIVICPPNITVCDNDPAFPLAGAIPAGGTYFIGAAPVVNFNPATAPLGATVITYSYIDPITGCTGTCAFTITVVASPVVNCPPNMNVNIFDAPFALAGATPAGGIYLNAAGDTIVWFDPIAAGLGDHDITYEFTDQNGCSNSCTFTITVSEEGFGIDFGDAPEDTANGFYYPTTLAMNGARHIINPNIILGDLIDGEFDGQPAIDALSDDKTYLDDEDGVEVVGKIAVGSVAKIKVKASADGYLNAWIDFENNGTWADSIDQIFADMPVSNGWNTLTFSVPSGIIPQKTYARYRFNTTGGLSYEGLANNGEVEDYGVELFPNDWNVVVTDLSHTILVPFELNIALKISDEYLLEPNDVIGVFYDDDGIEKCGGAIIWGGNENQVLAAYGDDPLTTGKDGFDEGEPFRFKVYKVALGQTFNAWAGFDPGMPHSDGTFHNNGMSAIDLLNVTGVVQNLELSQGWNGISTYLIPADADIENMFEHISNSLIILYNLGAATGPTTMYSPYLGIMPTNPWDVYQGYFAKLSQDEILAISGDEVINKTIQLPQGWSLIPVLSNQNVDAEELFGSIDELVMVKAAAGTGVYWKAYSINTLGAVKPDHAYWVYMSSPGTLTYPIMPLVKNAQAVEIPVVKTPWNNVIVSPKSHLVTFDVTQPDLHKGDIIGGFNNAGMLAGGTVIDNPGEPFIVTLFGNDPYSVQSTGLAEDENLSFRLYRPASGETWELQVTYHDDYMPGYFAANAVSVATDMKLSATSILQPAHDAVVIYPNPSSGVFHLEGVADEATIEVMDTYSKRILSGSLNDLKVIDLTGHAKGVYFVTIQSPHATTTIHKIMVH
jgi:hypothetical protein